MKTGLSVLLFFLLFTCASHSQTAYLILSNSAYNVPDKYFKCGDELKLRLKNGNEIKGPIESIFADGLVLSGDSILFSQINKFSYKYTDRKKAKSRLIVSSGIMVSGIALVTTWIFRRIGHEVDPNPFTNTGATIGMIICVVDLPFLADGMIKEWIWRGNYLNNGWNLHGTMI
ncbi:MAG TPA: hypothetical protein VL651_01955 [Bacteroidia bacterium]|jgi:hypothetical protein|nr:hypothetical protein [Bacteroidia bacterium]